MPVDTADIITEEAVRAQVEDVVQEELQFRRAFRTLDASGINNATIKVPQPDDVIGEPAALAEGSEYPNTEEDWTKVNIDRQKYGMQIPVTMEAQMDSTFDVVRDLTDRAARQMAEKLNSEAFTELNNNLATESPVGGNNGTLSYDEVLTAKKELRLDGYAPDLLIIEPEGEADLLSDPDFTRSTDLGDDVVTEGQITRVSGIDVVVSNTGDLGTAEALLIDTDFYGYEATWRGVNSSRYEDESKDTEFMKINVMKGWKAMDSEAAIKITG